jgi:hypothetical protein
MLGLGAAGIALDPEKLLWVPGAKKIFVPKPKVPTLDLDCMTWSSHDGVIYWHSDPALEQWVLIGSGKTVNFSVTWNEI